MSREPWPTQNGGLAWDDATTQAERVRSGELTAMEAVQAALDRMAMVNPLLNVIVSDLGEEGLRAADTGQATNGALWGVPFLRKDLGVAVAGEPLYLGNRVLREMDYRPDWTSELAVRFSKLGLIAVGTTNTPEMGAQTTTQPLSTGPTRNPWNTDWSASGSSGGSGAAVAAGIVPIAHANDYLGSTRLPAAWQGLYGLKPSRGRVPLGASATSRMSSECVITRSVRDLAAVLDGICGHAPGELWAAVPPAHPYAEVVREAAATGPSRLRVGVLTEAPAQIPVAPAIVGAVRDAGQILERLGHDVTWTHPAALFEGQRQAPQHDRPSDYRRRLRVLSKLMGRTVREDDVEPFLWAMAEPDGETLDEYLAAETWQQEWSARVTAWWERDGHDILLTPTAAMFPEPLADLAVRDNDPASFFAEHISRHITFTAPFNVTGQPALAMPLPAAGDIGPPPSVQIVAAPQRDDLVLAVAAMLEQDTPAPLHPPVNATGKVSK